MPRVGFEPTIAAGERPYTYALDRAATGTGFFKVTTLYFLRLQGISVNNIYTSKLLTWKSKEVF